MRKISSFLTMICFLTSTITTFESQPEQTSASTYVRPPFKTSTHSYFCPCIVVVAILNGHSVQTSLIFIPCN